MLDFARLGIEPPDLFQTLTAMAPGIMLQEKLTPEGAAARAFALIVACAQEVERAYGHRQAASQVREEVVGARQGSAKDESGADGRARDLAARQVLARQGSFEAREPTNQS